MHLLSGAQAIVTRYRSIRGEHLDVAGPVLRLVQVQGGGAHRVDLEAARSRGIAVAVMPSRGAIAVAEHTLSLMLALARQTVRGHRETAEGAYRRHSIEPLATSETVIAFNWLQYKDVGELYGKTLGLLGFGEIGQEVARRARAFGMTVLYHKRRPLPGEVEAEMEVRYTGLEELLRESDWVSLHAPHTPETERLLDERKLALLKPTAFLINTARGGLVDEEALARALEKGRIAGAGLDVFVKEPLPADHPFTRLPSVVLSPHLGGGAGGGHRRHVEDIIQNVARFARGEPPLNRVS
jgi:phosphoglycerate dehydrogenase-like enzyme